MASSETAKAAATVAFVPGTGRMGSGLALLFARAGHRVLIGSRDAARAEAKAAELRVALAAGGAVAGAGEIVGLENAAAARTADVVHWCIQGSLADREAVLRSLADVLTGKIVVDITNIMYFFFDDPSKWGQVSCVDYSMKWAPGATWLTAWKTCSFKNVVSPFAPDGKPKQVQVTGDDGDAKQQYMAMVNNIGYEAVDFGPLLHTRIIEIGLAPPMFMIVDRAVTGGKATGTWRFMAGCEE